MNLYSALVVSSIISFQAVETTAKLNSDHSRLRGYDTQQDRRILQHIPDLFDVCPAKEPGAGPANLTCVDEYWAEYLPLIADPEHNLWYHPVEDGNLRHRRTESRRDAERKLPSASCAGKRALMIFMETGPWGRWTDYKNSLQRVFGHTKVDTKQFFCSNGNPFYNFCESGDSSRDSSGFLNASDMNMEDYDVIAVLGGYSLKQLSNYSYDTYHGYTKFREWLHFREGRCELQKHIEAGTPVLVMRATYHGSLNGTVPNDVLPFGLKTTHWEKGRYPKELPANECPEKKPCQVPDGVEYLGVDLLSKGLQEPYPTGGLSSFVGIDLQTQLQWYQNPFSPAMFSSHGTFDSQASSVPFQTLIKTRTTQQDTLIRGTGPPCTFFAGSLTPPFYWRILGTQSS